MEHTHTLYHNDFGIAFQWKQNQGKNIHKIQLVFRETGLFLTKEELLYFKKQIGSTLLNGQNYSNSPSVANCRSILLETPVAAISFAVSRNDLNELDNLIEGALFQLGFNNLLTTNNISKY